ncbi:MULTISPECIES: DUF4136 domain-containing protein [unclassified Acidovorax]|uniref:DUF4136 domain-containing protein n=1 Tax=unclassified Acidovorax TaxID=2684926 RepID=UPI0028833C95|nr:MULTISPECIES: DUF4136 domain-containing protein [unclassified Acidovorax]
MTIVRWLRPLLLCAAAAVLAGCASTRVVDSDVRSYSTLAAMPQPATYRLERLPSQTAHAASFNAIESLAQQSLARVGLQRDDANARLVLQISAQGSYVTPAWAPYYADPFYGRFGWGFGYGGRYGWGLGSSWMLDRPPTLHRRFVSLVLRDATTQQIVYETSAVYEDVWTDDPAIFGLLFDAALTGFPQPPAGPRQVRTTITPGAAAAGAPATSTTITTATPGAAPPAVPGVVVKP